MVYTAPMSPKKAYTFMIEPDDADALKRIKERDGINESEQIRRGLKLWLEMKGELKTERKRVAARKRS